MYFLQFFSQTLYHSIFKSNDFRFCKNVEIQNQLIFEEVFIPDFCFFIDKMEIFTPC